MHWLESQLAELNRLADAYVLARRQSSADIINISETTRLKRSQFIDAVQALVNNVGKIKGISACAAYHDGLILAQSDKAPNMEAFGALVQDSIRTAQQGAEELDLGAIEQIVIVGTSNKVAMLSVGPLILSISSPKHINLALALSQGA
ncbi:roadblock/LC7 domain-containing protein [Methylomonas sp. LL1]|uniref:roadblock/LC7 domain-containing protein n=1 Tax=Methylomonas sp. LL1 TaxID=2785785 RepID=UPI0018C369BA|nr:roadblock/LC7 domain-containing protein [Methylomonas sp. LL1]QPK65176.1 roadblock/LC7 domain-containing protein [Methylomonas sp. LL1]